MSTCAGLNISIDAAALRRSTRFPAISTHDDLERLGYGIARYAQGRLGVVVSGAGRGFDVDNANVEVDLRAAAVETPWSFWTKSAGQAASVRLDVARQTDGGLTFDNIDARGAGLVAQGSVRIARDERIMEMNLTRLAVEGRSDARISATRASDGGLDVAVRGALFDAAPFMEDGEPVSARRPRAAVVDPPVRATVIVDRLKMRGDATLSNANVQVMTYRGALAMLVAEGQSPSGRPFTLGLGPRPGDPVGRVAFRSEDAGFAVRALTGSENVVGGVATAEGDWRTGPPSTARFSVRMRNFQVVRLPAMARLLSSAGSLTGLVEMLNGDGIGFSNLEAQMVYANNRLTFTEGSMRGPSLGLTASGGYDIGRDNLDVDGVVAPSFGLNSLLGNVPLFGNLFVSRQGEGVVGMTYSINGHAAEPRVGVNPVVGADAGHIAADLRACAAARCARRSAHEPAGGGAARRWFQSRRRRRSRPCRTRLSPTTMKWMRPSPPARPRHRTLSGTRNERAAARTRFSLRAWPLRERRQREIRHARDGPQCARDYPRRGRDLRDRVRDFRSADPR